MTLTALRPLTAAERAQCRQAGRDAARTITALKQHTSVIRWAVVSHTGPMTMLYDVHEGVWCHLPRWHGPVFVSKDMAELVCTAVRQRRAKTRWHSVEVVPVLLHGSRVYPHGAVRRGTYDPKLRHQRWKPITPEVVATIQQFERDELIMATHRARQQGEAVEERLIRAVDARLMRAGSVDQKKRAKKR
jgi:hypothetical protein